MLKQRLEVSGKTLAKHLKSLKDEGLLKREIQGKYIVYVVVKPQTVLEMRKEFRDKLTDLRMVYHGCLTKETINLLDKTIDDLEDSIVHSKQDVDVAGRMLGYPEGDLDKTKIVGKTMKLPKGLKKGTKIDLGKSIYDKPQFVEPSEPKKRGRRRVYG